MAICGAWHFRLVNIARFVKPAAEAIALHGTEDNFERVEKMSPEAFEESVDDRLAALDLHAYWMAHPQEKAVQNRSKQKRNRGVTILVRAAVVRNLSSAACIKSQIWVSASPWHPIRNLRLSDHPTSGNNPAAIKNCTPITAIPQRNTTTSAINHLSPVTRLRIVLSALPGQ